MDGQPEQPSPSDQDQTRWTGGEVSLPPVQPDATIGGEATLPGLEPDVTVGGATAPPPQPSSEASRTWASAVEPSPVHPDMTQWSGPGGPAYVPAHSGDPTPAEEIGGFRIVAELGRGGMGAVYRAVDSIGREVALKVILGDTLSAAARERFLREGQVTAGLRHPGIVRVLTGGEHAGRPFLVYELVERARSLKEAWAGESTERKVRWVVDAARALGHAHRHGVIHRDVKPDNLLVDARERLRVSDFGLAAAADLDRLTRTGATLGTPRYMAPEQVDADRAQQGPPTDVWALGVVLYQALTGERPFDGQGIEQIFTAIVLADPVLPRRYDPHVDRGLEAVCLKALAAEPADRYPTGAELADDMERALDGEQVHARPIRPLLRALIRARWALVVGGSLVLLLATALLLGPVAWSGAAEGDVRPPVLSVETPTPGQEFLRGELEVTGTATDDAEWIEVWVDDQPRRRVASGERFRLSVTLAPGTQTVTVHAVDAVGNAARPVERTVRVLSGFPQWFSRLDPSLRPHLPLPEGLSVTKELHEYRWERDGSILVWVPAGTFTMGGAKSGMLTVRSKPGMEIPTARRRVTISRGFFIGKYELTWGKLLAFKLATTGQRWQAIEFHHAIHGTTDPFETVLVPNKRPLVQMGNDHPAMGIPRSDITGYLRWAGLTLRTEAEWEYAARGSDGRLYPWGDEPSSAKLLNSLGEDDGHYYTAPVGSFPAGVSPFGCLDMAGNVMEAVSDRWGPSSTKDGAVDPQGPSHGKLQVARGGCWLHRHGVAVQSAMRYSFDPSQRYFQVGFRVVLRHPKAR